MGGLLGLTMSCLSMPDFSDGADSDRDSEECNWSIFIPIGLLVIAYTEIAVGYHITFGVG